MQLFSRNLARIEPASILRIIFQPKYNPTNLPKALSAMQNSIIKELGNNKPEAAIIWLHGLGADGNDFVPILPELGLDGLSLRFIFPNADSMPVSINNGMVMPAWYDIRAANLLEQEDKTGTVKSQLRINAIIDEQIKQDIDSNHIILAGFSQGGAIALYTGLRFASTLGGIIALSTYLPFADSTKQQAHNSNLGVPIFMAHGTQDPVVSVNAGRNSKTQLEQLGYRVQWHEFAMQHSVHPDEITLIGKWIRGRLGPAK